MCHRATCRSGNYSSNGRRGHSSGFGAAPVISQNSIFPERHRGSVTHEIGIDLQSASDNASLGTSPFVTLNDSEWRRGGNGLLNYPILQTATVNNGQLTLTGFAGLGRSFELFIASLILQDLDKGRLPYLSD